MNKRHTLFYEHRKFSLHARKRVIIVRDVMMHMTIKMSKSRRSSRSRQCCKNMLETPISSKTPKYGVLLLMGVSSAFLQHCFDLEDRRDLLMIIVVICVITSLTIITFFLAWSEDFRRSGFFSTMNMTYDLTSDRTQLEIKITPRRVESRRRKLILISNINMYLILF